MTLEPDTCKECGHAKRWNGSSHEPDCPYLQRLRSKYRYHPSMVEFPAQDIHKICREAFAKGGTACSNCTVLLCEDDACSHAACGKDRFESLYI